VPVTAGSLIYIETNRDGAAENAADVAAFEQDTVVHEVGHAVGRSGDHPVTLFEEGGALSRYTASYLNKIRSNQQAVELARKQVGKCVIKCSQS